MKPIKALTLFIGIIPVNFIKISLLNLLGHNIHKTTKIKPCLLILEKIETESNTRIGYFNIIRIEKIKLSQNAKIGHLNSISGRLNIDLNKNSSIGNRNKIICSMKSIVIDWISNLSLGDGSIITSDHYIDCTRDISLGKHSIIAGSGTQLWTHGYIHEEIGQGRYRIDGAISITNNVYIGSRCIFNLGVSINTPCTIGAGTTISKDINEPGLYVSSPIRKLPTPKEPHLNEKLTIDTSKKLCEPVFRKNV